MNILGDLERDWDAAKADLARMTGHGHPAPQPSFTPSQPSQPEVPRMSVSARLADAERAVEALASHIRVLAANPLVDTIIESGLGLLLTPAEVVAVRGFIAAIEAGRAPAADVVQAGEGVATAFAAGGTPSPAVQVL